MTGRYENAFRYGDVTVSVPLDAPAPITPAPAATEGEQITVILRTPNTIAPLIQFFVISDHDIPPGQGYFALEGKSMVRVNSRAIPAGEEYGLFPAVDGHWQDVTGVAIRTLHGNRVRNWQCEDVAADRHAIAGRYTCTIQETAQVPNLATVEDARLWVYLAADQDSYFWKGHLTAHLRAGDVILGQVQVWLGPDSLHACKLFATNHPFTRAGETQQDIGCRGEALGWSGEPSLHTAVTTVTAASGIGLLRCDRHVDSNAARSVWACDAW